MWGGYLSDLRSAKELFAAKLQKISESSSPYHTKITFDLTERLVENHPCCRLTHLPEVCRYRCKSVKDDLVDRRIIVGYDTYIFTDLKTELGSYTGKCQQSVVVLRVKHQINLIGTYDFSPDTAMILDRQGIVQAKLIDGFSDLSAIKTVGHDQDIELRKCLEFLQSS